MKFQAYQALRRIAKVICCNTPNIVMCAISTCLDRSRRVRRRARATTPLLRPCTPEICYWKKLEIWKVSNIFCISLNDWSKFLLLLDVKFHLWRDPPNFFPTYILNHHAVQLKVPSSQCNYSCKILFDMKNVRLTCSWSLIDAFCK